MKRNICELIAWACIALVFAAAAVGLGMLLCDLLRMLAG
jgi:hypothetical protein